MYNWIDLYVQSMFSLCKFVLCSLCQILMTPMSNRIDIYVEQNDTYVEQNDTYVI